MKITTGDGAIKTIFHEVRKKSEIRFCFNLLCDWYKKTRATL